MGKIVAKTSASAVANLLLDFAENERIPIRHLKLQKLVYLCYAWYAGNQNEELFRQDIEAWKYGPVVRDVYTQFKDCKDKPILKRASGYVDGFGMKAVPIVEDSILVEQLREVWDAFKDKSDGWLLAATHARGEPWEVFMRDSGQFGRAIPFELIRSIYRKKVDNIAVASCDG